MPWQGQSHPDAGEEARPGRMGSGGLWRRDTRRSRERGRQLERGPDRVAIGEPWYLHLAGEPRIAKTRLWAERRCRPPCDHAGGASSFSAPSRTCARQNVRPDVYKPWPAAARRPRPAWCTPPPSPGPPVLRRRERPTLGPLDQLRVRHTPTARPRRRLRAQVGYASLVFAAAAASSAGQAPFRPRLQHLRRSPFSPSRS
jgi:hypothetical protein